MFRLAGLARRLGAVLVLAGFAASAHGQSSVTLAWDPSSSTGIAGYRVYVGSESGTYSDVIEAGNSTTAKVSDLVSGETYFFAVTAYNTEGVESDFSNEISYTVALPAPRPPTISLTSPADATVYDEPATISLAASVTANGHDITEVQFYSGATLLGVATAAPYSFSWNRVTAGTYSLSARAIYDSDSTVSSTAVNVTVSAAPPPSGTTFAADSGTFTAPFVVNNRTVFQPTETSLANGGRATYGFNIVNAGNYLVSAMVLARNEGQNSFYVNIDAEPTDPFMIWDVPISSTWASRTVSWRGNSSSGPGQYAPKVFTLSAGTHQLIIRGREANTMLGMITVVAAPPKLQILRGPGGSVILRATGQPGQPYVVLCSTDLKTWAPIGTLALNASGLGEFTDSTTRNQPSRMYRLQSLTAAPPRLQIRATAGGPVVLSGTGPSGQTYNVLCSQNLRTWTPIGTVTPNTTGAFTFTDPAGNSLPNRFYRLQGQ